MLHDISKVADFTFLPTKRACKCPPQYLNCLSRRELMRYASTVIDEKQRVRWEQEHPARFIPQVPEKFIQLFSHRGETVLDPFCGSGTTNLVALQLGRSSIGIDVNEYSVEIAYKRLCDAQKLVSAPNETHHRIVQGSCLDVLPLVPDNSIDLIVTSPPYLDVVDYNHQHPEQWGNISDYTEFLRRMELAFRELKRVLKPKGWMVVVTQDVFKRHAKCPLHADYIFICRDKLGLEIWSTQVYILNYSTGGRLVFGYPTSYYPKNDHEYILVFRKKE